MNYNYDNRLGLACITDTERNIKVLTPVARPGQRYEATIAYTMARYSRSAESVENLLDEARGVDADKRLHNIFYNYGHGSVQGLATLSVCFEGIPLWFAFYLFNTMPLGAGQERSTRYQKMGDYYRVGDESYDESMDYLFSAYEELYEPTREALARAYGVDMSDKRQVQALDARTLDCTRYLLPMGARTSLGITSDAETWSRFISDLLSNQFNSGPDELYSTIGHMLKQLLGGCPELEAQGYVAGAPGLIRHAEARHDLSVSLANMARAAQSSLIDNMRDEYYRSKLVIVQEQDCDIVGNLVLLLQNDLYRPALVLSTGRRLLATLREELTKWRHYDRLPTQFNAPHMYMSGYMDVGAARDFNRHRSVWRYFPALTNVELLRGDAGYTLPLYVEHLPIAKRYREVLDKYYETLDGPAIQYRIPLAHNIRYCIGGTHKYMAYVCQLRSRVGGHINYRVIANEWANSIAEVNPLFDLTHIIRVVENGRDEFLSR